MTDPHDLTRRPLAYEEGNFFWNLHRIPPMLSDGTTPHPGRSSAIFVVHGIGQQQWTETAAQLRAGFEDAFEDIAAWQRKNLKEPSEFCRTPVPPPFIYDGYWADYADVGATFPDDWIHFNQREQKFFDNLWKLRVVSGARSLAWMLVQQLRLLHPNVLREVGLFAWLLYVPLQIVSSVVLLFAWVRHREAITGFVNDVRLYLDPRGVVERAIVQRIDDRVGQEFLRLIGLNWEFRRLSSCELLEAGGERLSFKRIVWVAHSLGTVISYNVLSALFHRAAELERTGDDEQKAGTALFRRALSRFVTLGSPLDKVAFLFKDKSLRPWPTLQRRALLMEGETLFSKEPTETEWWVNFYHVLDPISGALESPYICGNQPPSNIHIRSGFIPGLAHVAYWKDRATLRFILGRTFGSAHLKDKEFRPWPPVVLSALAAIGYFTWAGILFGVVYALYRWTPELLRVTGKAAVKWLTG